jgi:hypothetical protein
VQAYNFRISLTDVPANRVPIAKPADYNPLEYELLARHLATLQNVKPGPRQNAAIGLRGNDNDLGVSFHLIPNRKTDSNSGGAFGSDMIGASYGWPEADHATREKIFEQHKTYNLGLLWFLGNDERVPAAVRAEMLRWGLPKDEFTDNGHFPHQLYVREARRMIGEYVMTENHARGTVVAEDPVALASYPLDSHSVTFYVDEQGILNRERGFITSARAFPISYRALRPRAAECDNLLVLSCLSASHAAYGSVRMEPVFMMLGHAAGAAASLAIEQKTTVQAVPYGRLRERLLAEKQILERPAPRPAAVVSAKPGEVEAQLGEDLKVLVQRKMIDAPDYWLANAVRGKQCPSEKVGPLLLKMAASFQPVSEFPEAVKVLAAKKIFNSTAVWAEMNTPGKTVSGEYVRTVIRNYVRVSHSKAQP